MSLVHAERRGSASSGSWRVRDINWSFAFRAQHYGTAFFSLFILIALALVHYLGQPKRRPFFLYDASISYVSGGDTVPAAVAVLIPFASLFISLCCYELWVYKLENWHITNAVATIMHFMLDSVCAFVTVECFTESTKLAAGRLRPDFFQQCQPDADWTSGPALLGVQQSTQCTSDNFDGRKSFCSGHASSSSVLIGYNIVYLLWAGKQALCFEHDFGVGLLQLQSPAPCCALQKCGHATVGKRGGVRSRNAFSAELAIVCTLTALPKKLLAAALGPCSSALQSSAAHTSLYI